MSKRKGMLMQKVFMIDPENESWLAEEANKEGCSQGAILRQLLFKARKRDDRKDPQAQIKIR